MGFVEYSATLISQGPKKTFAARCIREIREWAKIVLTEADRGATVRVYQVQEVLTTVFDKNYPCQHCGIPVPFGYDAEHKCQPAPETAPSRCPTCSSPDPCLHPFKGYGGRNPTIPEEFKCRDPWHERPCIHPEWTAPQNPDYYGYLDRTEACPDCKSTVRSHYNAVPVGDWMQPCRHRWHGKPSPETIRVKVPDWWSKHGPTCNAILTGKPEACNCPASHSPDWKPGLEAHP